MRELDVASQIAREAGSIVLKHYAAGVGADEHKNGEPVTLADRESDAFIVGALRRAFPDDEIVSEESVDELVGGPGVDAGAAPGHDAGEARAGAAPDAASGRPDRGERPLFVLEHAADAEPPLVERAPARVWYVDPMDGTSDFVKRTDDFVVMIGLAIAGWPVLGVVYHPPSGTLYRGGHGIAAEKLVEGVRTQLRVSDISEPGRARLVVSRSHTPDVVADVAAQLGIEKMEKCGSVGLKAARVAEGAGELYLHPSIGTKLWDTCAPEAILVAAGGTLSDCDGRPLVYDRSHLHNKRGLAASNGRLHDAALGALRKIW